MSFRWNTETVTSQQKLTKSSGGCAEQIELAIADSYKRLLKPSLGNEAIQQAKEKANDQVWLPTAAPGPILSEQRVFLANATTLGGAATSDACV